MRIELHGKGLFAYPEAGHASGGPFFSALPEKKGEKRGAGYGWRGKNALRSKFAKQYEFAETL